MTKMLKNYIPLLREALAKDVEVLFNEYQNLLTTPSNRRGIDVEVFRSYLIARAG